MSKNLAIMYRQLGFIVLVLVAQSTATSPEPVDLECTGDNIVYDPCPNGKILYCDDLKNPPACDDNEPCKPRCRCADGYLINYDQKCIPIDNCYKCIGPNEFFSCGIPCDRACNNLDVKCDIISDVCTERCYCKNGYARNEQDICIPITKCKLPRCEDPNAIYRLCKTCPGTCQKPNIFGCSTQSCMPGCSCKDGYVHTTSTNNTCIKLSECNPNCKDPNAEYSECKRCVGTCEDRNVACVAACLPGCSCKVGYVRKSNKNDTCIKESQCPIPKCKDPNAEYSECKRCANSCETRNIVCPPVCIAGCSCKVGYVQTSNKNNTCIKESLCPDPKCKDPNAEHSECKRCVGTCENREVACPTMCIAGCSCKVGYVRTSNKNDTCIKESLCPKDARCPGKNQYYTECVNNCPEICPSQTGGMVCPAVVLPCKPGCRCIAGYLSSKIGCVAPKDCPPFVCDARPNEVYSRCGEKCTETCASFLGLKNPYCRTNNDCYPECICKKGYVRSGGFRCVATKRCGSCYDPNEEYLDCGPSCERTCQNPNRTCDEPCVSGCFCQPGYIRDGDNICIPYTDCPVEYTDTEI